MGYVRASRNAHERRLYLQNMKLALCFLLTSCTIGGSPRMRAASSHHLATVPPEALDDQNPGADTSKNPMISRDTVEYREDPPAMDWRGGAYDALAAFGYALAITALQ